jgi:hypothetical protein
MKFKYVHVEKNRVIASIVYGDGNKSMSFVTKRRGHEIARAKLRSESDQVELKAIEEEIRSCSIIEDSELLEMIFDADDNAFNELRREYRIQRKLAHT